MSDLHQRITRMYEVYAPEKLSKVPQFLASNAGHEEEVLEKLIEKYGPEPASPRKTVTASSSKSAAPPSPFPPNVQKTPSSPPSAPVSATPASPQQPAPQPILHAVPSQPPDPMMDLRMQVRNECGFLTREHELMWEDAWMGKMPLGTLRKTWDLNRSVLLSGLGNKMSSHARPVRRWQKRFFVLAPPFLYYFNSDQPSAICKGALYLDRATIVDEPHNGARAITIQSRVSKKPLELDRRGDYSTFIIGFDTEKQHGTWANMLKQVAQIGDVGSAVKSFGAYPLNGPGMLNLMASSPTSPLSHGVPQGDHQAIAALAMLSNTNAPIQPPPGVSQAQFQNQQIQHLNSIGVTPQLLAAAAGSPNRANLNPLFNNYTVDAPEIKRRIARLSRDRDPVLMADVFLRFVQEHVENAPLLWKLMASMEEIEPFTGPTYTQAQLHLNNAGYSLGYGNAGALPQQALINVHRHLFAPRSSPDDAAAAQQSGSHSQLLLQEQLNPSGSFREALTPASFVHGREPHGDLNQTHQSVMLRTASTHQTAPHHLGDGGTYRPEPLAQSYTEDSDWQRRMGRIRDRRHLVDRLMKDLPNQ